MVYRGRVEKGVVIIDGSTRPQEGAIVRIEEVRPSETQQVGQELDSLAGLAQGLPPDLAQRHDHYQQRSPMTPCFAGPPDFLFSPHRPRSDSDQ